MKYLQILLAALCFFGCRAKEVVVHENVRTEYIRQLVPVVLPDEGASASALLECAENGAVLLSRFEVETSKNARMTLMIDSMNNLSVEAIVERDTVFLKQDSVIITRDVLKTEIAYKEKELSIWQNVRLWAGNVSIILIVIVIGYLFFKFKFK